MDMYTMEYCFYEIINGGQPFIIQDSFKSLDEAKLRLYEITYSLDEKNYRYYVDNDFFNNKYENMIVSGYFHYFKIMCRRVEKWCSIDDVQENTTDEESKLIFHNF